MSMSAPFEPNLGHRDEGIPAADPGAGAPEPADGFGIGGEEPDQVDPTQEVPTPGGGRSHDGADPEADARAAEGPDDDPPFRTPDPAEVKRG